jgi:hypothetical protein
VLGAKAPFEAILAAPGTHEPTRFGDLAMRLWTPLIDAETLDVP